MNRKFTLRLAAWRRLATVERLQKFGIQVLTDCIFCTTATCRGLE
ncbi:hypothetical protein RDI58_004807 [Solanum bulbocastanum]|uniref:Uncharacterized protein n=1 Tax=Solanum bulbocastanum TaxID=147425 RepID=A0AAN8TZQ7_SOLBU